MCLAAKGARGEAMQLKVIFMEAMIMYRDGWNFHNDIAINLENEARKLFKWDARPEQITFDADAIESGNFAEDMIILLRKKTNYSNSCDDIDNFVVKLGVNIGKSGTEIGKETAQELFDEFKIIYRNH